MTISLIVAMDRNRLIGNGQSLPWLLPADLKYFKQITQGNIIIMGRTTYESIGRPLPDRINLILTRDPQYKAEGCYVYNSVESLLYEYHNFSDKDEEVFVIGGSDIYKQFLPHVDKLYITEINHEFQGDVYFPEFDQDEWELTEITQGLKDERNPYDYFFTVRERINNK